MRFDFNHIHSWSNEVPPWADVLKCRQDLIVRMMETIMASMQDLKAAVQRNRDIDASVVTLLQGLSQQLKDAQAQNDPAAIQDVIDQMDANTHTLSDAVTANTPAASQGSQTQTAPQSGQPNT